MMANYFKKKKKKKKRRLKLEQNINIYKIQNHE